MLRDPGRKKFGSGIRDGKHSDPGSMINIPDPQHCKIVPKKARKMYCRTFSGKLEASPGALEILTEYIDTG
jgi:hypothetical protein